MKLFHIAVLMTMIFLSGFSVCNAATVQMPEWYSMTVDLKAAPRINQQNTVEVKLTAIVGNLQDSRIRLIAPDGWQLEPAEKTIKMVSSGQTETVSFKIVPTGYLAQGSIIAEAGLKVPFAAIEEEIRGKHANQAEEMIKSLRQWPTASQRYSEISFALMPEESFYPLTQGMWLNYADNLSATREFRGPVFFDDAIITTHQAQTDVEMYEKLLNYSKADPGLTQKLIESGIDLKRKKFDQLNGLYVLATRLFMEKNFQESLNFLNRLETELIEQKAGNIENLEIAAYNLKGLVFWGLNQKRLAEEFLKKAFYRNRKNPLQRYVLRNIGLLMYSGGEKAVAEQMFGLAAGFNTGYTLLEQEYEKVKSP